MMPRKPPTTSRQTKVAASAAAADPGAAPPLRQFSRSLPMSLLRSREAVMRHFRPALRRHGLTEQQWRILRALTSVEEIEVTGLARMAYLLGPSLSRMLRDLEARGLISRRAVATDLRRGTVSITPKGVELIAAVAPLSEAIYAQMTETYGAANLARLQEMLAELERELMALPVLYSCGDGGGAEDD